MTVEEPQAPKAAPKARALRPRDAATLIIVDNSSGEPRVLLGRRRLDMVFMPGRYVFPGGRVDPADKQIVVEEDLMPRDLENRWRPASGHPSVAGAAQRCRRETFEEAGLLIGMPLGARAVPKSPIRRVSLPATAGLDWLTSRAPCRRPAARAVDSRSLHEAEAIVHRAKIEDGSCRTSNGIPSPRRAR
jgi:8-oxo-dGTP pyrophosphatase MutT (NUDIX family)